MYCAFAAWGTSNSSRATSHLVRLVEGEESPQIGQWYMELVAKSGNGIVNKSPNLDILSPDYSVQDNGTKF
ncbi:hypothetical protein TNCV_1999711 [Trichonephila clavipes]|nr:hypothetical protein TNCV_2092381 [Trichonephila clavipes]GFV69005.1 hypothetical protein TNCV_1999711 [Trichonephila clavipes]